MKRFISIVLIFLSGILIVTAQNFPDAQKQPKQKEMGKQHKKFVKQAKRHRYHHRKYSKVKR